MKEEEAPAWTSLEEAIPKELLRSEVLAWAKRIGVEPKEIRIRPMKRKWGSCSTAGRVTLSDDMLSQPADFRKKIIVHELVHLKVPNHGKLFRALVKSFLHRVSSDLKEPDR
jgi:predicted metal-dependent hydrolase